MSGGDFIIKDRHGNDLFFGQGGDVFFPQYELIDDYREQLKNIKDMELREDDIILVGYPRSGTHWHNQILHMLQNNTSEYVGSLNDDLIDWKPLEKLLPPDKPRVFVSYLRFHHLPRQVLEKKVKVVYSFRNPKDSWVSYYNCARDVSAFNDPYTGTWAHFYDLMMDIGYWYGDWFDHVLDWERAAAEHPDIVFLSCYELMKKHFVDQITRLDQFLGLNRGPQLWQKIAEACHFSKMKAGKGQHEDVANVGENSNWLYRKGEIGDWKNWFTMAQSEHFDAVFQKRMAGSQLPMIFQ